MSTEITAYKVRLLLHRKAYTAEHSPYFEIETAFEDICLNKASAIATAKKIYAEEDLMEDYIIFKWVAVYDVIITDKGTEYNNILTPIFQKMENL